MTNKEKSIYRLLAFANFLASAEQPSEVNLRIADMSDTPDIDEPLKHAFYDLNVFELLPDCFDDWFFECRNGNPIIEGYDDSGIGTVGSVFQFFYLISCQEFMHLFDISHTGQSCDLYGGAMLNRKSTLKNYAQNIVEFVNKTRR